MAVTQILEIQRAVDVVECNRCTVPLDAGTLLMPAKQKAAILRYLYLAVVEWKN